MNKFARIERITQMSSFARSYNCLAEFESRICSKCNKSGHKSTPAFYPYGDDSIYLCDDCYIIWYSNKSIGVDLPKCSKQEFKLIIDALNREDTIAWELRQQKQKRREGYLSNIDGVLRTEELVLSKMEEFTPPKVEELTPPKVEEPVDSPTLKMEYEKKFYYNYTSGSKGYHYTSSPHVPIEMESVD